METETASCQMMFWTFLSFGDFLNNRTLRSPFSKGSIDPLCFPQKIFQN